MRNGEDLPARLPAAAGDDASCWHSSWRSWWWQLQQKVKEEEEQEEEAEGPSDGSGRRRRRTVLGEGAVRAMVQQYSQLIHWMTTMAMASNDSNDSSMRRRKTAMAAEPFLRRQGILAG